MNSSKSFNPLSRISSFPTNGEHGNFKVENNGFQSPFED